VVPVHLAKETTEGTRSLLLLSQIAPVLAAVAQTL
jgi:hypothetical protein